MAQQIILFVAINSLNARGNTREPTPRWR